MRKLVPFSSPLLAVKNIVAISVRVSIGPAGCAILAAMMEQKLVNKARIVGYVVGAVIVVAVAVSRFLVH